MSGCHGHSLFVGALALVAACAVTPATPAGTSPLDEIGERLVENARARTRSDSMRVWVYDVHDARHGADIVRHGIDPHGREDATATLLKRELVHALADKAYLVETEIGAASAGGDRDLSLSERARAVGATHVLVGDYEIRDGMLVLSIRLIEASSLMIVAMARGEVPLDALEELTDQHESLDHERH